MVKKSFNVEVQNFKTDVETKFDNNLVATLYALSLKTVELTIDNMQSRYGAPIRISGDLMRSITGQVNLGTKSVDFGSNLVYAARIHEGWGSLVGRPYLADTVLEKDNQAELKKAITHYMGDGFDNKN